MICLRPREENEEPRREESAPPAVNVWKQHDPYELLGEEEKLCRPGRCYRVPEGLDEGGKRKRRHATSLQDFRSWFRGTFDPPEHKMKNGPSFTDLNHIYLSTMKEKLRSRRRICRRAGLLVSDEEFRKTFLQPEEAGPQGVEPVDEFAPPDPLGEEVSDGEDVFPDDLPAEFRGPDLPPPEGSRDEMSYEDLVKLRVEQMVVSSRGFTQETALSRRVKEWEELIRPELRLQEERPIFDIHDYGGRIVSALQSVGRCRSFSSIVAGKDNHEACKYLLASLQLANDYTVELSSSGTLDSSLDSMDLTLLSTARVTDRLRSLVPSS